jgi:hypothetical protein
MRKALVYLVGAIFLLSAIAFAADKPGSEPVKANSGKVAPVRVAKMNARGKVIEISDKSVKIERTVKDKVETMEFGLEKPLENIAVNDNVKIAYIEKEGVFIAARVAKVVPKKPGTKETEAEKSATPKK